MIADENQHSRPNSCAASANMDGGAHVDGSVPMPHYLLGIGGAPRWTTTHIDGQLTEYDDTLAGATILRSPTKCSSRSPPRTCATESSPLALLVAKR